MLATSLDVGLISNSQPLALFIADDGGDAFVCLGEMERVFWAASHGGPFYEQPLSSSNHVHEDAQGSFTISTKWVPGQRWDVEYSGRWMRSTWLSTTPTVTNASTAPPPAIHTPPLTSSQKRKYQFCEKGDSKWDEWLAGCTFQTLGDQYYIPFQLLMCRETKEQILITDQMFPRGPLLYCQIWHKYTYEHEMRCVCPEVTFSKQHGKRGKYDILSESKPYYLTPVTKKEYKWAMPKPHNPYKLGRERTFNVVPIRNLPDFVASHLRLHFEYPASIILPSGPCDIVKQ
eukprot:GILJ01023294.1.p1 GENE.GILJ01023294.1~~GILJ01023294.1.p1  ORF type:complete len:288 (+),score=17.43 GILJ01023294.1:430-1293(+)